MTEASPESPSAAGATRRVRPIVALRVLEVMRDQDLPPEILEAEDPTQTMPRRLGLSDVVERQIRTYRDDVRRRVRLTDAEIVDLFRLVIRRPDGEEIFKRAGQVLAGLDPAPTWRRVLPRGLAYRLARARVGRGLKKLFGRRIGGFAKGPFIIEGRGLLFIAADPGGDACHFMSGFCEASLRYAGAHPAHVGHTRCQSRGDPVCRWEGAFVDGAPTAAVGVGGGSALP